MLSPEIRGQLTTLIKTLEIQWMHQWIMHLLPCKQGYYTTTELLKVKNFTGLMVAKLDLQ